MTTSTITATNVDLSNCDRELIQYPGKIQPHGAMLVVDEPSFRLLQVSANVDTFFGLAPNALLNSGLESLLKKDELDGLRTRLAHEKLNDGPRHLVTLTSTFGQRLQCLGHRIDEVLILEFEPALDQHTASGSDFHLELRAVLQQLQATTSLKSFFDLAVWKIRQFTGFERVLAYQFDDSGNGKVIAEAKRNELEPYLGLHYPATDIPEPARRLFSMAWLRHLPDVSYRPWQCFRK